MRHLKSALSPALVVSSRREYAQHLESRLEAEEHVFLIIPLKKKRVSNFSQIVSSVTPILPRPVDSLTFILIGRKMWIV